MIIGYLTRLGAFLKVVPRGLEKGITSGISKVYKMHKNNGLGLLKNFLLKNWEAWGVTTYRDLPS